MTESPRRVTADDPMAPYDAVLIGSFGGPRGPEEVTPFLRRVSGGRIPESRLADVAEHYHHFGGVSPINETTDELVDAIKEGLARVGSRVPVVLGNRNGTPFMADALRQLHDHGARRVLMLATSAFASYSGCRQYREDAAAALAEAGISDMEIDKLPPFHEAPGFAIANAEALMRAFEEIPPTPLERTRVLFVTHSIPQGMQDASGPGRAGTDYVSQHMSVCSHIADLVRRQYGNMPQWDLVYCSRSGRPTDPWLEPDVNDHLRTLPDQGVESVVLAPVGFVVDHMEVVNDLDREASQTAREIGLSVARARTAGAHPALVAHLVRYLTARAAQLREGSGLPGEWTVPCATGCCLRGDGSPCRPAVSGEGDSPLPDTSDDTEPGAEHHPGGHGPGPDGAAEGWPGHGEHEGGHPGHDAPVAPVAPPAPAAPHAHLHEDRHRAGHPEEESMDHRTHHDEDVPAGSYTAPTDPRDHAVTPDEVNAASLWAMYSVFRLSDPLPADAGERGELLAEACQWIAGAGADTRGWYDLSGLRADADLLVWWTSDDPAVLQETYHRMRASWLGRHLEPVWSNLAVHRPAEFNKSHLPSCFAGVAPRRWAAFYPFVRTKDWYLLPAEDRSRMLREHGVTGAASPDVKASTLAAFALGDYEWILTLEGDDLARVVDVMKDLRYVEARRHVEVDIPFFTGERVEPQVWADRQVHR